MSEETELKLKLKLELLKFAGGDIAQAQKMFEWVTGAQTVTVGDVQPYNIGGALMNKAISALSPEPESKEQSQSEERNDDGGVERSGHTPATAFDTLIGFQADLRWGVETREQSVGVHVVDEDATDAEMRRAAHAIYTMTDALKTIAQRGGESSHDAAQALVAAASFNDPPIGIETSTEGVGDIQSMIKKAQACLPEGFQVWSGGEWTGDPKKLVKVIFHDEPTPYLTVPAEDLNPLWNWSACHAGAQLIVGWREAVDGVDYQTQNAEPAPVVSELDSQAEPQTAIEQSDKDPEQRALNREDEGIYAPGSSVFVPRETETEKEKPKHHGWFGNRKPVGA